VTITYIAAAAEPDAGWGKLVALIVTALAFWAFTVGHKRYKQLKETPSKTHSSDPPQVTVNTVKPQVTAGVTADQGGDASGRAVVVHPTPPVPAERDDDGLEAFVALRLARMNTTQVVREAEKTFGVSAATAWRAVRRARDASAGTRR
jgi:hypothetical protein